MSKKRPRNFKDVAIQRLKNQIRDTSSPITLISQLKSRTDTSLYTALIKTISEDARARARVFGSIYPTQPDQLKRTPLLNSVDLERELRWARSYLLPHTHRLTQILQLTAQYNRAILQDDYGNAQRLLDDIQRDHGYSLWLLKSRVALLQDAHGTDRQRSYVNNLRTRFNLHDTVEYILTQTSVRNEPILTASRFIQAIDESHTTWNLRDDFNAYLRYHLIPSEFIPTSFLQHILRHESNTSILDYFEALVCTLQLLVIRQHQPVLETVAYISHDLASRIADHRLTRIATELRDPNSAYQPVDVHATEALSYFLKGHVTQSLQKALDQLNQEPDNINAMRLASQGLALLGEQLNTPHPTRLHSLIQQLKSVLTKDEELDTSRAELTKYVLNHLPSPTATGIQAILLRASSYDPLDSAEGTDHHSYLASSSLHPFDCTVTPHQHIRRAYAERILSVHSDPAVKAYLKVYSEAAVVSPELSFIESNEQQLLQAELGLIETDYENALVYAQELASSKLRYYQIKGTRLKAYCLQKLGRVCECVHFIASVYVEHPEFCDILPVSSAVHDIDHTARSQLSASLSLSILYDIHSKLENNQHDDLRLYAYEDFLTAHHLTRPSQLVSIAGNFDRPQLIYFLRYLCVESIMDLTPEYQSSREVIEERSAICLALCELDPSHIETYQNEIKDIVRRLTLTKRRREIEQSKIYVDTTQIRTTALTSLAEAYSRYQSFRRAKLKRRHASVELQVRTASTNQEQPILRRALPPSDAQGALHALVTELRDLYVSSTEYGLDGYLSVRIRHGTLSGQLRSPLEAARLITQKDAPSARYRRDEYWLDRLGLSDERVRDRLAERLAQFSESFDCLVTEIVTDWIQVRKNANAKGLFNFEVTPDDINLLATSVTDESTLEEFVDLVLLVFTRWLESNLAEVRDAIQKEAKPQFSDLMWNLQSDIEGIILESDLGEITNTIKAANTEIQVALDRVTEWFQLSEAATYEPFDIQEAIQMADESVVQFCRRFTHDSSEKNPQYRSKFPGALLPPYRDVFFLIFENIVRHSRLEAPMAVVQVSYESGSAWIHVENPISHGVDNENSRKRISQIQCALRTGEYRTTVSSEGGTGFYKLWKALSYDIWQRRDPQFSPPLEFGFTGYDTFYVRFAVPKEKEWE